MVVYKQTILIKSFSQILPSPSLPVKQDQEDKLSIEVETNGFSLGPTACKYIFQICISKATNQDILE